MSRRIEMYADVIAAAKAAHEIELAIREIGGDDLHADLSKQCAETPKRMAQIIMVLAAWCDPNQSLDERGEHVEAISRWKAAS
jgi:hypothetical protein